MRCHLAWLHSIINIGLKLGRTVSSLVIPAHTPKKKELEERVNQGVKRGAEKRELKENDKYIINL
jgi:hypothetical protein